VSGELGHYWFGTTSAFYGTPAFPNGIQLPAYTTYNFGVGFTWKVFTLDLRYSDTDLNKGNCNAFTSDWTASQVGNITPINPAPGFGSKWCGATGIDKLSVDTTLNALK